MGGLEVAGVAILVALILSIQFAKAAHRADDESRVTAERLAMQNRDWMFPRRGS